MNSRLNDKYLQKHDIDYWRMTLETSKIYNLWSTNAKTTGPEFLQTPANVHYDYDSSGLSEIRWRNIVNVNKTTAIKSLVSWGPKITS